MLTDVVHKKLDDFLVHSLTSGFSSVLIRNRMRKFGTPKLDSPVYRSLWNGDSLTLETAGEALVIPNVVRVVTFSYGCKIIVKEDGVEKTAAELYKPGPTFADEVARVETYKESRYTPNLNYQLHRAVEKSFWYSRMKQRIIDNLKKDNLARLKKECDDLLSSLVKLNFMVLATNQLVGDHLIIRVIDKAGGKVVVQGSIVGITAASCRIRVKDADGHVRSMTYAKEIPVPKEYDQPYYGHEMIMEFEVLSLDKSKDYILS